MVHSIGNLLPLERKSCPIALARSFVGPFRDALEQMSALS